MATLENPADGFEVSVRTQDLENKKKPWTQREKRRIRQHVSITDPTKGETYNVAPGERVSVTDDLLASKQVQAMLAKGQLLDVTPKTSRKAASA